MTYEEDLDVCIKALEEKLAMKRRSKQFWDNKKFDPHALLKTWESMTQHITNSHSKMVVSYNLEIMNTIISMMDEKNGNRYQVLAFVLPILTRYDEKGNLWK